MYFVLCALSFSCSVFFTICLPYGATTLVQFDLLGDRLLSFLMFGLETFAPPLPQRGTTAIMNEELQLC
jgi:hypothetical protein